jgi:two-component system sensor histidine kinase YesM
MRAKLLVSSFFLIILPYTLVGFYQIEMFSKSLLDQAVRSEEADMAQLRQNISEFLSTITVISDDIYFDKGIWEYFTNTYPNPVDSAMGFYELIQPRITLYKGVKPELTKITIYTSKQDMLKNEDEIADLTPGTKMWEHYEQALENPYSFFWKAESENGAKIVSMYRILRLNNYFIGLLKISFKESKLRDYIKEQLDGNVVCIISPEQIVLSATDESLIGRSAAELGIPANDWDKDGVFVSEATHSGEKLLSVVARFKMANKDLGSFLIAKTVPEAQILSAANKTKNIHFAVLAGICLMSVLMDFLLCASLGSRLAQLADKMRKVQEGRFDVSVNFRQRDEISRLGESFNTMVKELERLVGQVYQLQLTQKDIELKKREAELYALQNQISPHFLFNTLEAVLATMKEDPEGASRIVALLARSLRRITRRQEDFISLREELGFISDYLAIQKYRLMDKLSWAIECPEILMDRKIPPLTLQPIAENAVHHGISMKRGPGFVSIVIQETESGGISMTVEDNGAGIGAEELLKLKHDLASSSMNTTGAHIGLKNVSDRIKLCYGAKGSFEIDGALGKGVTVRITLGGDANAQSHFGG